MLCMTAMPQPLASLVMTCMSSPLRGPISRPFCTAPVWLQVTSTNATSGLRKRILVSSTWNLACLKDGTGAPPVALEQRPVKLLDRFAAVCGHSPDVGEIRVFVKEHRKSVCIKFCKRLAGGCDQPANGFLVVGLPHRIRRMTNRRAGKQGTDDWDESSEGSFHVGIGLIVQEFLGQQKRRRNI
jgi:hypothetical protein